MKPKRRRLYFVLSAMAALGVASALILYALEDSIVFFYSPSDILEKDIAQGRPDEGGIAAHFEESRDALQAVVLRLRAPL